MINDDRRENRLDRRGEGIVPDWERDPVHLGTAIRTIATMLLDHRERSAREERERRAAAIRQGYSIDTRADYLSGSNAAYAIACSIVAGAIGVARVEEIIGRWVPNEPERPILPSEITADPDEIAVTVAGGIATMQHRDETDLTADHHVTSATPERIERATEIER